MGATRTRPSRNIHEASFTVANLPDATSKSCTIQLTGLPTRGVLHRISLIAQDGAAITGTDVHAFLLSTDGTATATSGGDTSAQTELDAGFYLTSFREADAPEGALDVKVTGTLNGAHIELLGSQGATQIRPHTVTYDVSGTTKGPAASDGVMYATIVGAAALNDLTSLKVRLEIESCF